MLPPLSTTTSATVMSDSVLLERFSAAEKVAPPSLERRKKTSYSQLTHRAFAHTRSSAPLGSAEIRGQLQMSGSPQSGVGSEKLAPPSPERVNQMVQRFKSKTFCVCSRNVDAAEGVDGKLRIHRESGAVGNDSRNGEADPAVNRAAEEDLPSARSRTFPHHVDVALGVDGDLRTERASPR